MKLYSTCRAIKLNTANSLKLKNHSLVGTLTYTLPPLMAKTKTSLDHWQKCAALGIKSASSEAVNTVSHSPEAENEKTLTERSAAVTTMYPRLP